MTNIVAIRTNTFAIWTNNFAIWTNMVAIWTNIIANYTNIFENFLCSAYFLVRTNESMREHGKYRDNIAEQIWLQFLQILREY